MQSVLPFPAGVGSSAPKIFLDFEARTFQPTNPRALGCLLSMVRRPEVQDGLAWTCLSDSILFSKEVERRALESSDLWISENFDLCRILAATEFSGLAFGGPVHRSFPSSIKEEVDRYQSVCRNSVRNALGLFGPPPSVLQLFSKALPVLDDSNARKELPRPRLDRYLSTFVSLFRVRRDRRPVPANTTSFVTDDDTVVFSVDLYPLGRLGRAVVVDRRGR